jgi:4-alpha-glucanotransferase
MSREGLVGRGLRACTVRITKTVEYEPQTGVINYQYVIVNTGDVPLDSNFAVEFNINFLAGNAADRYYSLPGKELDDRLLNSRGEVSEVREFGLVDEWKGITTEFVFDRPANMWRLPLETVSQSEDGMERVYQGSSVFPRWQVRLEPAQSWHVNFIQKVRELGRDVN